MAISIDSWPRPCRSGSLARRSRSKMWSKSRAAIAARHRCSHPAARSRPSRTSPRRNARSLRSSTTPSRPRMRATAWARPKRSWPLAGVKAGMSGRRCRRGGGLLYRPPGAAGRTEGPGPGRGHRARHPRRAQRSGPAREARQCCGQARHCPTIRCFRAQSFDRVFLVHMYHEVQSPYAFLWHLRDGVKPDGLVIVVDSEPADQAATESRRRSSNASSGRLAWTR